MKILHRQTDVHARKHRACLIVEKATGHQIIETHAGISSVYHPAWRTVRGIIWNSDKAKLCRRDGTNSLHMISKAIKISTAKLSTVWFSELKRDGLKTNVWVPGMMLSGCDRTPGEHIGPGPLDVPSQIKQLAGETDIKPCS